MHPLEESQKSYRSSKLAVIWNIINISQPLWEMIKSLTKKKKKIIWTKKYKNKIKYLEHYDFISNQTRQNGCDMNIKATQHNRSNEMIKDMSSHIFKNTLMILIFNWAHQNGCDTSFKKKRFTVDLRAKSKDIQFNTNKKNSPQKSQHFKKYAEVVKNVLLIKAGCDRNNINTKTTKFDAKTLLNDSLFFGTYFLSASH